MWETISLYSLNVTSGKTLTVRWLTPAENGGYCKLSSNPSVLPHAIYKRQMLTYKIQYK